MRRVAGERDDGGVNGGWCHVIAWLTTHAFIAEARDIRQKGTSEPFLKAFFF